jgi:hypothetical protein
MPGRFFGACIVGDTSGQLQIRGKEVDIAILIAVFSSELTSVSRLINELRILDVEASKKRWAALLIGCAASNAMDKARTITWAAPRS